jgi:hypothetical protein
MIAEGTWDDFGADPIESDTITINIYVHPLGTTNVRINRAPDRPIKLVAQEVAAELQLGAGDWRLTTSELQILTTSKDLVDGALYDLYRLW